MDTLWTVHLDSHSFTFDAYGATADQARETFRRLILTHADRYQADPRWVASALRDGVPVARAIGAGYTDGDHVALDTIGGTRVDPTIDSLGMGPSDLQPGISYVVGEGGDIPTYIVCSQCIGDTADPEYVASCIFTMIGVRCGHTGDAF